nr:PAAR domain-containing protein [Burkholderia pseudomallei]
MSAFIVEGDTTSHGGKVFGCASVSIINGKRIARLGDMVSCPKCGGA